MKFRTKAWIGTIVASTYFILYITSGAMLFANIAAKNPNHVPWYMPFAIFLWIVGLFVGHFIVGKLYNLFIK